ncbi:MAG: protease inhibitor I42 family protein [Hydrogenophilaceae bacterium]|jgi:inhibitor of cysteine peptidase|nr:protease inhibitor I42 family protein [Hydrogenophilaceae bacterium]
MRIFSLLIIAGLAACAPQAQEERNPPAAPPAARTDALPAPTPSDVAVRIAAANAGATVAVAVGQRFAVELVGVPTAGYLWEVADRPDFIIVRGEAGGPTSRAQLQPGFAGGNHWEVTIFEATGPGVGTIRMVQRRPWETDIAPVAEFAVTIEAR